MDSSSFSNVSNIPTPPSPGDIDIKAVILPAITATLLAVLQVGLVVAGGYLVARLRYLDKKAQKVLNTLNLYLFTPALIFSKIALVLSLSKLIQLAIVP